MQTPKHNFFSLVRGPDQTTFDAWCTEPPVAPFETGFLDASSEAIRDWIAERIPIAPYGSNLEPSQYAILDNISIDTNTVIFGNSYSTIMDRDIDTMTEEEREAWERELDEDHEDDAWKEWRVSFKDADEMSTKLGFPSDFTPKLYNDDFVAAYTDGRGVFDYETAHREWLTRETIEGREL